MGSITPAEPVPSDPNDDVIVLVTGFGPFRAQYPLNPSWEIASALPPLLTPSNTTASSHRRIRILVHPSPIRVAYDVVRELVPKLWKSVPKIDFVVHIGMAAGREYYSVERKGHRDGYRMGDVDGKVCEDEMPGRGLHEVRDGEKWIWDGCPPEIETDVNIVDVQERWRASLPKSFDVRTSSDAGRYLCDFIYYSSLAELYKSQQDRRVVFLHVPVDSTPEVVETGKTVTEELIRALVASRDAELEKVMA